MKRKVPLRLQIERLRQLLMYISDQKGFGDAKVLELSQKIDELLNVYERERRAAKSIKVKD